jgi:hypothetical protein
VLFHGVGIVVNNDVVLPNEAVVNPVALVKGLDRVAHSLLEWWNDLVAGALRLETVVVLRETDEGMFSPALVEVKIATKVVDEVTGAEGTNDRITEVTSWPSSTFWPRKQAI